MTRQGWPTSWLLTDERMGAGLSAAISRAAQAGAGIIVRHHVSPADERMRIAEAVLAAGATLGISRDIALAEAMGAALIHNPAGDIGEMPFSLSVHDFDEATSAACRPAAIAFVSPVYATRSHPLAPTLGEAEALRLAKVAGHPAIALGGMDEVSGARMMALGFHGWAGIDAWLRT